MPANVSVPDPDLMKSPVPRLQESIVRSLSMARTEPFALPELTVSPGMVSPEPV
ncbi:MAG: hypothetical protein BWX70_01489 [Verrucomicrobia bacterium ADurb.Bin070]|nr:MAG: hypothetical protein BWX70_01489 [Verrucomicrobia bacterium ADurb.Bin070]